MDDQTTVTRRTYDRVAGRFLQNTRDRSAMRPRIDGFAASLPAEALVLDLGAGPGCDSAELRARGLCVVSTDLSLGMLRAGLARYPGPRVQADLRQLPFSDACVPGVWANACLLHLSPDGAVAALHEIRRVLSTGGVVHISVKFGTGGEWESDRYGEPRWFQYWSAQTWIGLSNTPGFASTGRGSRKLRRPCGSSGMHVQSNQRLERTGGKPVHHRRLTGKQNAAAQCSRLRAMMKQPTAFLLALLSLPGVGGADCIDGVFHVAGRTTIRGVRVRTVLVRTNLVPDVVVYDGFGVRLPCGGDATFDGSSPCRASRRLSCRRG